MNKLKILLFAAILVMIPMAGCGSIAWPVAEETGHYYTTGQNDLTAVGKLVIFELDDHSNRPDLAPTVTETVAQALGKKHLFGISTLHRSQPQWRSLDLDDTCSYQLEDLANIRKQLKADAALFGSITHYRPYPHLLMGLHLKMVDLRDGRLLWAVEQVWDSTDNRVERRMKKYFDQQMRTGYQPMDWQLLITSPRAFNKFIAYEVAATLPGSERYRRLRLSSPKGSNFSRNPTVFQKSLQIPQKTLKFAEQLSKIQL